MICRCLLFLLPFFLAAEGSFTVFLETEETLVSVALHPFKGNNSPYLRKLEEILLFDLNQNGMTEATLGKGAAAYHLEVSVHEGALAATLRSDSGHFERRIDQLLLEGSIARDRKVVHQLADAIYRLIFHSDGIAQSRILYTVRKEMASGRETSEVWEADYDGYNAKQLTRDGGYCVTPCYLPPEKGRASGAFFYVSFRTGQSKVYVASRGERGGRRLFHMGGNQLMPTISRQRDQIAFVSDVTGNADLFVQSFSPAQGAIGKPRQIFTKQHAVQGTPTFSPDGRRIAFVSNKDGLPRIYAMPIPAAGAPLRNVHPELITKYNRQCTAPAWSPDGAKIAYCSRIKGVRQICLYDFSKGEERQLTDGPLNKENPSWAPNSQTLVYNTTDAGKEELYLLTVKHPKPVKISSGSGSKRFPCWEPL